MLIVWGLGACKLNFLSAFFFKSRSLYIDLDLKKNALLVLLLSLLLPKAMKAKAIIQELLLGDEIHIAYL